MASTSHDEFVDLYDVMGLPTDADSETIRQRLNVLYLEAQQNLDHRNAKRRLQYQQMYEIYLPQGRHLLLDPRRRAEYDRYLNAYHTGKKVEPASPSEQNAPTGELTKNEEPPIPGMVEVEVDPEVLAAEREDMWAKWKVGLESVGQGQAPASDALSSSSPESFSTAPQSAQAATQPSAARPPAPRGYAPPRPGSGERVARTAPPAPRSATAPRRATPTSQSMGPNFETKNTGEVSEDVEKHREQQRQELIKDAVQTAGLMWGAIYGGGLFFLGCIILFVADIFLKPNYFLGLKQNTFALLGFLLILAAATFAGLMARRNAKQRTSAELSSLSLEQLMRRNRGK